MKNLGYMDDRVVAVPAGSAFLSPFRLRKRIVNRGLQEREITMTSSVKKPFDR